MNPNSTDSSRHPPLLSEADRRCDALINALLKAPANSADAQSAFTARTLARLQEENARQDHTPLTVEALEKILFNPNRLSPSANFTASVLERIHAENDAKQTRSTGFWRMAGTFAVAAALLMAVGIYVQQPSQTVQGTNLAGNTSTTPARAEPVAVVSAVETAKESPLLAADWSTALAVAEARESADFTFASAQGLLPTASAYHGYRPQVGMVSTVSANTVPAQARTVAADPALVNALLLADGLNNARPLLDSDTMQALVVLSR